MEENICYAETQLWQLTKQLKSASTDEIKKIVEAIRNETETVKVEIARVKKSRRKNYDRNWAEQLLDLSKQWVHLNLLDTRATEHLERIEMKAH